MRMAFYTLKTSLRSDSHFGRRRNIRLAWDSNRLEGLARTEALLLWLLAG